jgi:PAS domain S-box-containing protein
MKHILIVEDEADHAELIRRSLLQSGSGYEVTCLGRLDEAEKFISQITPSLALVDYRLPDGHGDSFVTVAAGRFPVILLTAYGNERTAVEAIKAGALDYIVKSPEMFADVVHLVERALREWHNLQERKQAEARLEAINELLATMSADFAGNVDRLITLLAREIGAQMVFYNQLNGKKLRNVSGWQVAAHMPECARCQCAACQETLAYAAGHLLRVGEFQLNPELETLAVQSGPQHTLVTQIIRHRQQPVGVLCLFFTDTTELVASDRRLLGIFSAALAAEENRKRSEDELRASDDRFRQIVQTANEGIWVTDEHECLTFVNQRIADMLGYRPEEMLRRTLREFVDPAEISEYEMQVQRRRNGETGQFERRLRHKLGYEVLTFISACPLFDEGGIFRGGFAMLTDITERRQLEMQLRQVQKLESIGQLAGGVAHDFNNILAAIMMHLSLLHQNPALDVETAEAIKELETETKRAANLTRQLLMFSRRSVMQVRPTDINEVVQNLLKMLRRLLGEHITIHFESHNNLPGVDADIGMLEQVLLNLAVNARDAMPKGGSLSIATAQIDFDTGSVKHHSERRLGKFVLFSVADTGTGMDEVTLKRIFEPFFTTKDVGKGTGLGLPTAYGIVKQHQGWIEVHSQLGRGSVFEVYLPARPQVVARPEPSPSNLTLPRGQGTLLLVEDEDIVRRPIGIYLRKLGYKVIEASNGREAIKLWHQHRNDIDLLYTDMVMPEGITGLELAEKLKGEKDSLRVIISSGYSTEISNQGITTSTGFIYLPKPSASATIASTVRECLDSQRR